MVSDTQLFFSIVSDPPPAEMPATPAGERRRSFRRPLGTIATLARIIHGEERNRLHVLVMNRSEDGVGLRCPIGLVPGAIYRLQIGSDWADGLLIRILTSRHREDETYDIGAACA